MNQFPLWDRGIVIAPSISVLIFRRNTSPLEESSGASVQDQGIHFSQHASTDVAGAAPISIHREL